MKDQFDRLNERGKYKLPKKYKSYKDRAYRKNITFELAVDEFNQILSNQCVYCGNNANTIDRIDSKQGYILSNCQSCCSVCNIMKYTYSHEQFITHMNKIYNHLLSRMLI